MLVKGGPQRYGYAPWTHDQVLAGLKINPYMTSFDFQWIGDQEFFRKMCICCRCNHTDFVLHGFYRMKEMLLDDMNIHDGDKYLQSLGNIPKDDIVYEDCSDPTCVLYDLKRCIDCDFFTTADMKYIYNHASFHSKVMDELKQVRSCTFPPEVSIDIQVEKNVIKETTILMDDDPITLIEFHDIKNVAIVVDDLDPDVEYPPMKRARHGRFYFTPRPLKIVEAALPRTCTVPF